MITKEEAFAICNMIQKTHDIEEMQMLVHAYEKLKAVAEGVADPEEPAPPKKRKKLDREQVIKMYEAGKSQTEIAAELDCTPTPIHDILKEAGIIRPKKPVDKGKILAMWKSGRFPNKEIAADVGCSPEYVSMVIREAEKNEAHV